MDTQAFVKKHLGREVKIVSNGNLGFIVGYQVDLLHDYVCVAIVNGRLYDNTILYKGLFGTCLLIPNITSMIESRLMDELELTEPESHDGICPECGAKATIKGKFYECENGC